MVEHEGDRLKSVAEALRRGFSKPKAELLRRVPSRRRERHLDRSGTNSGGLPTHILSRIPAKNVFSL